MAGGLRPPSNPASTAGRPNIPLPTMLLRASATMLQRPISRAGRGRSESASRCPMPLSIMGMRAAGNTAARGLEGSKMRYSYATHLECSSTGERHDIGTLQGLSAANKPLLARYDLAGLARDVPRATI